MPISHLKELLFEELGQNEFALQQQLPMALQKLLDTMEAPPEAQMMLNGSILMSDAYAESKARLVQPGTHLTGNSRFY